MGRAARGQPCGALGGHGGPGGRAGPLRRCCDAEVGIRPGCGDRVAPYPL